MKRKLLTLTVCILIPALLLSGCFLFRDKAIKLVKNDLSLDISAAKVNLFLDTHINGTGGLSFASATFPDAGFTGQLSTHPGFHALPFSQEITDFLYSTDILLNEKGELLIPYADNGYYYFDFQMDENTNTPSADMKVALYNGDTNEFYYCHFSIDNLNVLSELESMVNLPQY